MTQCILVNIINTDAFTDMFRKQGTVYSVYGYLKYYLLSTSAPLDVLDWTRVFQHFHLLKLRILPHMDLIGQLARQRYSISFGRDLPSGI